MRSLRRQLTVTSANPPTIEFDPAARAVYVRFLRRAVKRTLERSGSGMIVTVDLDQKGEVVGVESIGFDTFSISQVLKAANVRAQNIDFSKAQMRATPRVAGREMVPA
jgi:uncharacterized protein YuzE